MSTHDAVQLINEALSRVRMPKPRGTAHAEPHRSARMVAMRARSEQDRQLGG